MVLSNLSFFKVSHSEKYRPDIDGLRALAVLLVIFGHFFPTVFPRGLAGGYIGVDIFFVISGFLISTIIFKQLARNKFSFKEFYIRRIKRIFPSLIAMLGLVSFFCWYFFVPSEFVELLGYPLLSTTGFFRNIHLVFVGNNYFNLGRDPLLHLWSLAVEEQFYIFFPILMVVLFKTVSKKIRLIGLVIFLAFLASFLWNIWLVQVRPITAYYLISTRAWELLLGTGLAYLLLYKERLFSVQFLEKSTQIWHWAWVQNGVSLLALSGIIFAATGIVDFSGHYPGGYALLPTLGALFIMATPKSVLNRYLLSNGALVWVGLLSYSLYLWHWPLFMFVKKMQPLPSIELRMGLIGLTFVLAILSTVFIENPIRRQTSKAVLFLVSIMALFAIFSAGIIAGKIKPYTFYKNPELTQNIETALADWGYPSQFNNPNSLNTLDSRGFPFPSFGKGSKVILFFGDSNAKQYWPRVELLMKSNPDLFESYTVVFAAYPAQAPIPNSGKTPAEKEFLEKAIQFASQAQVERVVLISRWAPFFPLEKEFTNKEQYLKKNMKNLEEMILSLKKQGKDVFFFLQSPTSIKQNPRSYIQSGFNQKTYPLQESESYKSNQLLKELAIKMSVTLIDPTPVLSFNGLCFILDENNQPIYSDETHLRASFAQKRATFVDSIFE